MEHLRSSRPQRSEDGERERSAEQRGVVDCALFPINLLGSFPVFHCLNDGNSVYFLHGKFT